MPTSCSSTSPSSFISPPFSAPPFTSLSAVISPPNSDTSSSSVTSPSVISPLPATSSSDTPYSLSDIDKSILDVLPSENESPISAFQVMTNAKLEGKMNSTTTGSHLNVLCLLNLVGKKIGRPTKYWKKM